MRFFVTLILGFLLVSSADARTEAQMFGDLVFKALKIHQNGTCSFEVSEMPNSSDGVIGQLAWPNGEKIVIRGDDIFSYAGLSMDGALPYLSQKMPPAKEVNQDAQGELESLFIVFDTNNKILMMSKLHYDVRQIPIGEFPSLKTELGYLVTPEIMCSVPGFGERYHAKPYYQGSK